MCYSKHNLKNFMIFSLIYLLYIAYTLELLNNMDIQCLWNSLLLLLFWSDMVISLADSRINIAATTGGLNLHLYILTHPSHVSLHTLPPSTKSPSPSLQSPPSMATFAASPPTTDVDEGTSLSLSKSGSCGSVKLVIRRRSPSCYL